MKTSELTGAALDWAVAKCIYDNLRYRYGSPCFNPLTKRVYESQGLQDIGVTFSPSTNWAQGGPIIEREAITVSEGSPVAGLEWMACDRGCTHIQHGPTYLIAAMRCYVASKLGDDVAVPKELT
jgi:hypothetical protein